MASAWLEIATPSIIQAVSMPPVMFKAVILVPSAANEKTPIQLCNPVPYKKDFVEHWQPTH